MITRAKVVVALALMALTDDVIEITVVCDVLQLDIYKLIKDEHSKSSEFHKV